MNDNPNATSDTSATTQVGTGEPVGQPADAVVGAPPGTVKVDSEPIPASAQPSGEPSGEGSGASQEPVKDAAFWENQYKELQSLGDKRHAENTKLQETLDQFSAFGGPEQVLQAAQFLQGSPEFQQWLQGQQQSKYGMNVSEMDDSQKEAVALVETMIDERVGQKLQQIKTEQIDPLVQQRQREHVDGLFGQMDSITPEWRELQPVMEELAGKLSLEVQANPTIEDIQGLHMMALAKTGKLNEFGAAQYRKALENKKANVSDMPPQSSGSANAEPSTTLADAFKKSKASHGVTGTVRLS